MAKGPKFNNTDKNFTTRDSLGIDGVASSIQDELCPVVTTVTPRAFYWVFMVWNYYDFYTNFSSGEKNRDNFNKNFLKKNDYYFVLSNLILDNPDQRNLVGKDNTLKDYLNNPFGPYKYNEKYFVAEFGGMQYYNAGCLTLNFITDKNADGNTYAFPKLTEELGKPMALAFEKVIKNTEYYNRYRLKNAAIPKQVLEEFGEILSLEMNKLTECKQLLKQALFTPTNNIKFNNEKLIKCVEYVKFIYEKHNIKNPDLSQMREVLFDYFSPRSLNKTYTAELEEIVKDWEVVVGRQYLSMSIEIIWKFMLEMLNVPRDLDEWINVCYEQSECNKVNFNEHLEFYLDKCDFTFNERETLILTGAGSTKKISQNLENAFMVLIHLYNRFIDREDVNSDYLKYGDDISINELIVLVEKYRNKPVVEFLTFIMINWIVKRHHVVALNKLFADRDGYFYEYIDGKYMYKHSMSPRFNGIRLIQLMQVMKDLDMLGE